MEQSLEKYFLDWAESLIGTAEKVEKVPHGEEGVVYRIEVADGIYFLKIITGSTSTKEHDKLKWFQGKVPVPAVVGFTVKDGSKALLMTGLAGKNLATLRKEWSVEKVMDKLVEVLRALHEVDAREWPFEKSEGGKVLVHGDACLPNFIFDGDQFSGFIDLGDAKLATPEVDLGAAIWSLQFNLGKGYGVTFLEKYGYEDATEETAERMRLEYDSTQRTQGFLTGLKG